MSKLNLRQALRKTSILYRFRQLKNDQAGSSLPIWILGLAGSAFATLAVVDVGSFVTKQNDLSTAVHGAALAGANAYKGAGTQAELDAVIAEATRYFYANFNAAFIARSGSGSTGAPQITLHITPTIKVVGDQRVLSVDVNATVTLANGLTQLVSDSGLKIQSDATATRARPLDVEVVLALDTTGSMAETIPGDPSGQSKIDALKQAVAKLMDQLYGASDTPPPGIKVSIIPFSQSVNIGKLPGMTGMVTTPAGLESFVANNWAGCISERSTNSSITVTNISNRATPADAFDVLDTTPVVGQPSSYWTPYYADRFVMQTYKGRNTQTLLYNWFTGTYPAPRLATRADTSTVHNNAQYYTGNNVNSLQNLYETRWGDPNMGCSTQALELDSTYSKSQINTYANQLTPGGWTHTNVAMAWANRMISPQAPFNKAAAYDATKVHKYIVLMTDGAITAGDPYYNDAGYNANYNLDNNSQDTEYPGYTSSYGPNVVSRLSTDHKGSTAIAAMEQRLLMACQAAKFPASYKSPDGKSAVTIYTLMLGMSPSDISHVRPIYSTCSSANEESGFSATNPSSSYYVEVNTTDQLKSVFKSIGASISSLRFTK